MKRIGIIGTGQIAQGHLQEYAKIDEVEVVLACDVDQAALSATCEAFDIPAHCTDFRELLARDDMDAVDVCLHNNYHAPVTIAALQAGKHVYCEKPIAGSYADGKAMVDAARETGKMLHIQLSRIYSSSTVACKMMIDAGEVGRIYHARATEYRRRGRPYVDGYGTARFVLSRPALFGNGVPGSLATGSGVWLRRGAEEAQFAPAAAVEDGDEDVGVFDGLALLTQA